MIFFLISLKHYNNFNECTDKITGRVTSTLLKCGPNNIGNLRKIDLDIRTIPSLIDVCYSAENGIALYSKNKLFGYSLMKRMDGNRISFKKDTLENQLRWNIDSYYTQSTQKITLNRISPGLGDRYILRDGSQFFLAKGHLTPG